MAPLAYDENKVTYMAETDARNRRLKFGIKAKDRTRHVYVIGKTGMGKSTLLENMAVQDIQNGEGLAFIDPHGKTADLLMEYVPKERIRDVIYIAPFDVDYPISFNVLEAVDRDKRHLVVSGLMSTFKKIWEDAWSARMEYILTNTLLALLEYPGATLLGVNRMLSDKDYRKDVISHIKDPSVKAFWTKEFANYTERQAAEAVPAIQNKVGQFTANPLIRNMIGQSESSFDIRKAMDTKKIMIINLSKGKIGDENMKLLGGLIVTKIYLAAMSRADLNDRVLKMMPNFYLFVDEFQNFANASFADILSEARKYKLNLTVAHQYIEQMDETVRAAVFGNVGTMIAFRVGAADGEVLEKEFAPSFEIEDLVNLGFAQIYLKLMIDGLTSPPFSAVTLPPIPHPDTSFVQEIIAASREQFARPRAEVEAAIIKFHEPTPKPLVASKPVSTPKPPEVLPQSQIPEKPAFPHPSTHVPALDPTRSAITPHQSHVAEVVRETRDKAENPKGNIITTPTPAPAPAFKDGHSSLASALKAVQSRPVEKKETPTPTSTAKPAPKPVPLSTLSPKQPPKFDPKQRSPENVNELKNALAAVLGKKPAVIDKKPEIKQVEKSEKPLIKKVEPSVEKPSSAPNSNKPDEVPEDVLKKVLTL